MVRPISGGSLTSQTKLRLSTKELIRLSSADQKTSHAFPARQQRIGFRKVRLTFLRHAGALRKLLKSMFGKASQLLTTFGSFASGGRYQQRK
jgi:hypothetical protein